jgi:hypothetical protein
MPVVRSGQASGPIYEQTIYTLACTGQDGSSVHETATAGVVPVFQERCTEGHRRPRQSEPGPFLFYLAIRHANSTTAAPAAAAMTGITSPPPSASSTAM